MARGREEVMVCGCGGESRPHVCPLLHDKDKLYLPRLSSKDGVGRLKEHRVTVDGQNCVS